MAGNIRASTTKVHGATGMFCMLGMLFALAAAASAAEPVRLRISIPGLGSSSYPLIMAQK